MRLLITGGAGFIGTNCAFRFAGNKSNHLIIVDNLSRTGVNKNLKTIHEKYPTVEFIKSDVADTARYLKQIRSADVIIHLAGQTAVTTSITNPLIDFHSNLQGTFNLLEAIRIHNPQTTLLYSSTNKVYGDLHEFRVNKPVDETTRLDFISPYGCSKGAADMYILDYARIYGLKTVVFRQSCIYGPWQIGVEDQGWVAHFAKQYIRNKPLTIYGDGHQIRDLLYVEDLIAAYELAIKKISLIKGQVLNVGGGQENAYSLLQVIRILEKLTNNKVKIDYQLPRLGDQRYFVSANKKAKQLLGWQPVTDFKIGLKKLLEWQYNNIAI